MALKLSPDMLEAAYDLLQATPPFRGWKLPSSDDIAFSVARFDTHLGDYNLVNNVHHIRISARGVAHIDTLIRIMGHEMIHLYQEIHGLSNKNQHNADFTRRAKTVCRVHGNFDPGLFCG